MKFVLACLSLSLLTACGTSQLTGKETAYSSPRMIPDARQELLKPRPVEPNDRTNDGRIHGPFESTRNN